MGTSGQEEMSTLLPCKSKACKEQMQVCRKNAGKVNLKFQKLNLKGRASTLFLILGDVGECQVISLNVWQCI